MNNSRILIGKIVSVHGLKGLVKLLVYAEDVSLIESAKVYTSEKDQDTVSLTLKNPIGKYYLASAEGVSDRNDAERLRGTELWIERAVLPQPKKGEYFIADLIGLEAITSEGKIIGKIIAVPNFGAGDLLEIKPPGAESFYIIFNKENVPEVSLKKQQVTIVVPNDI